MSLTPTQIEKIVGEVVRRLRTQMAETSSSNAAGAASIASTAKASTSLVTSELVVPGSLLTMEQIAGRLAGIQKVVVGTRTIVTPAARDELKQRGVRLEVRSGSLSAVVQVRLLAVGTDEPAEKKLATCDIPGCERLESQSTTDLVGILREAVRQGESRQTPVLVASSRPFAAVVEANRLPQAKAVHVLTPEHVAQAINEAAANLFVVSSSTNSMTLRKIGERIAAGC